MTLDQLIHSFHKHLFDAYCMLGICLSRVSRTSQSIGIYFSWRVAFTVAQFLWLKVLNSINKEVLKSSVFLSPHRSEIETLYNHNDTF